MAAPTLHTLIDPRVRLSVDTPLLVGDLVGWDATNLRWTKADADTATRYAQWVCVEDSVSSGMFHLAYLSKRAIIEDLDAPFTANVKYYLSSTAGESTATRPVATSTSRLIQTVGYTLDTFKIMYDLPTKLREQSDYQQIVTKIMAVEDEKVVVIDSGNFASFNYNASGDDGYCTFRVPDKAVSLQVAYIWASEEAEVAAVDLAVTVGSALHAAQHDAVTADATGTAPAISTDLAADDIGKFDITAYFDATNIIRPGALLGILVNVTLGGTDTAALFGIEMVWNVVD